MRKGYMNQNNLSQCKQQTRKARDQALLKWIEEYSLRVISRSSAMLKLASLAFGHGRDPSSFFECFTVPDYTVTHMLLLLLAGKAGAAELSH